MADATTKGFTFTASVTLTGHYLLDLPEGFHRDSARRWPLVLFLHGAGERGDDLPAVRKHGPPKLVTEGRQFPFVLVAPQCPKYDFWSSEAQVNWLAALIAHLRSDLPIDPDRVYVTGLSMGGFGTWALACRYPRDFAAIAPICGSGDPAAAAAISRLPVWVFHGAKDQTVPLTASQAMVDALQAQRGRVRFTVYAEAGHDSWTQTYADQGFWDWLLEQRRTRVGGA